MNGLSSQLLNGFAQALANRFAEAAQGLDRRSELFVGRRPHERILSGFLTPAGTSGEALDFHGRDGGIGGDDDPYEQTHVGFEWSVPVAALGRRGMIEVEIGLSVFQRECPSLEEARANRSFDRQGRTRLVEVWRRRPVAGGLTPLLRAQVDLDEVLGGGEFREDLSGQVAEAVGRLEGGSRYPFTMRAEPRLTDADLLDEGAYRTALDALRPARPTPWDWHLALHVIAFPAPVEPDRIRLLLRVINTSAQVDRRMSAFVDPRLYGVSAVATLPTFAHAPSEFRVLPNSYRYDRSVDAIGINCQPRTERTGDRLSIRTCAVPVFATPRIMPRELGNATPTFEGLARVDEGGRILEGIVAAMREYDGTAWEQKLAGLTDREEREDAEASRAGFRQEIADFEAGVRSLLEHPQGEAARAFRLMNTSMGRAGQGRSNPITAWHLFQIVFVVSRLPQLVASATTTAGDSGEPMNILWFPAGGGKTEAFLGLIVWAAFFDRLSGKSIGVTAFVRYPLRLLTYQQLQRVSWVLGQAEEVRRAQGVDGGPFSLGYYVGQSTTPNRIGDQEHRKLSTDGVPGGWQRVFRCPSCGARTVRLRYNADLRLVEHFCEGPDCRTRGERLPVYIVDDDLYRYLPTVIVSTVDKLAQMGHNRRFAQLFGRVERYCPVHGASFRGSNRSLCEASREGEAGRQVAECAGESVLYGPFERPSPVLHVQDEMHLMREGLATFDSHYETAALEIQRSLNEGFGGWQQIGATATIAGYREQAHHLYLRGAVRFPSPGPTAYDSFYYHADDGLLGRLYIGLLGVGRTHTPAVARAIALLYELVDGIRLGAARDIEAAREYLLLPSASLEDIEQLCFLYEVVLTYVLTRKGGDQVGEAMDTRVRPDVTATVGSNLRIESFNSSVEMQRMIRTMEEIEEGSPETRLDERIRGVVATNIISHGVDVDRFNLMVFAGLPKQFAEYIQASARVGRHVPGLSVLVVTPQADRDRSVYDRFDKFHQYVDRLVEPVPINRWSQPALELTLRGILAAYLMGVAAGRVGQEIYFVRHVREGFGRPGWEALDEEQVVDWVARAVGAEAPSAPSGFSEGVRRLTARLYGQVTGAAEEYDRENINIFLKAMRSLRDVDEPAEIRLRSQQDADLLRALSL